MTEDGAKLFSANHSESEPQSHGQRPYLRSWVLLGCAWLLGPAWYLGTSNVSLVSICSPSGKVCGPEIFVSDMLPRAAVALLAWGISAAFAIASLRAARAANRATGQVHGAAHTAAIMGWVSLVAAFPAGAVLSMLFAHLI